jgi:hypothetical protein
MYARIITFSLMLLLLAACDKEPKNGSTPAPAITTTALPNTFNGQPYNEQLLAQGGTQPFAWTITVGALPNGLSLDTQTGVISGIANDAEGYYYDFSVELTDAAGRKVSADLRIFIDGLVFPVEGG